MRELEQQIERLTARVERLERLLDEPPVGEESDPAAQIICSGPAASAPLIDGISDALEALGFFRKDCDGHEET